MFILYLSQLDLTIMLDPTDLGLVILIDPRLNLKTLADLRLIMATIPDPCLVLVTIPDPCALVCHNTWLSARAQVQHQTWLLDPKILSLAWCPDSSS